MTENDTPSATKGKTFLLAGKMDRVAVEAKVFSLGGRLATKLFDTVAYVVVPDDRSAPKTGTEKKAEAMQKKGNAIKIVTVSELDRLKDG